MPRYKRKFKKMSLNIPQYIKRDVFGLLALLAAAFFMLSIFNLTGSAGRFMDKLWQQVFGWGWWFWPVVLFFIGYFILFKERKNITGLRWLGLFLFVVSYSGLLHLFVSRENALSEALDGFGGGLFGYAVSWPLISVVAFWGSLVVLVFLLLISLILFFDKTLDDIAEKMHLPSFGFFKKLSNKFSKQEKVEKEDVVEDIGFEQREISSEYAEEQQGEYIEFSQNKNNNFNKIQPEIFVKNKKILSKIDLPIELLSDKKEAPTSGNIKVNQEIIQKTLAHFGIDVDMGEVSVGPTVTQYTFKPASGVKVSQITTLSNDLALALAAHPIRIEAPIPGRSLVGVEVPNQKHALVSLKEILVSSEFKNRKTNLSIAIGKDVSGKPWMANLGKMPHLLIAGATGSGKTVGINSIIISLLYQNQPSDLKFIMVDPKRVELPQYNNIPHLLCPVITDVKKTINALRWSVKEMERRLQILSNANKRNIDSYNDSKPEEKIPYLIIVIDELADLMASAGQEIEAAIVRLAQMSRAVGIHLVLATQRP
ncbi:MAG: DNA translocase FtsK 4TM domain-containing protein, partial [Patescibacteria group bacterium]